MYGGVFPEFAEHFEGRFALSRTGGQRQPRIDDQAVAVLHQDVALQCQQRLGSLAPRQARIRIRRRFVRCVRTAFAAEIDGRVARVAVALRRRPILGFQAFLARPRLDQRPIDGEVLVRQQRLLARLLQNLVEESTGDVTFEQAVAVLCENRVVPDRVVDRQADEPAEQQVIIECSISIRSLRIV